MNVLQPHKRYGSCLYYYYITDDICRLLCHIATPHTGVHPSLLLKFCTHCIRCVVPPNWGGQPIN